jgi:homoserine dehydrogenase
MTVKDINMKTVRLVMIGFGNVGKAFVELICKKKQELADHYGVSLLITGIATAHHGCAVNPAGIDTIRLLEISRGGEDLSLLSMQHDIKDSLSMIDAAQGDVLLENSPVNHENGQPAIEHLIRGFNKGMHGITANKGPVVYGFDQLTVLAKEKQKTFRFESAVMDGAPIFSLHRYCLPVSQLLGFRGILNSCTNLLLTRMEAGESLETAISYAQSIGITETDPSADIDGWDAAIKVAALSTVLMGVSLKPGEIKRQGIREVTREMIKSAGAEGKRWKLVCSAERSGGDILAQVAPEKVGTDSPLFAVNGTSSYIEFKLDSLPGLGILESNPGPDTTAYGLLTDLINIVKEVR